MNLFHLLDQAAKAFPSHPATCRASETVRDFQGLRGVALAIGRDLARRFDAGERVAILSENCVEYVELLFGIWAAGLVAVPINYKLHPNEVQQILQDCSARMLVGSEPLLAPVRSLWSEVVDGDLLFAGMDALGGAAATPREVPVQVAPDALAWLFYTSGTTGRSKGAMLSHAALLAMTVSHLADVESLDENCSQLHAAPMSHGSGLYMLPSIARGARQVVAASGGFDAAEFLELCARHPNCSVFLAPTMVQRLRLAVEEGRAAPWSLKTIVYGGGPMYVEELRRSMEVFGPVFVQIFGQGESPMTLTWLRREDHRHEIGDAVLGSVGRPRTGIEVRIVDGQGREVSEGTVGEIVCRGSTVMGGYWNNPSASAQALRQGWLWTGDMGSMDASGCVTLKDRSKDLIITGGSNVYPREVEEVLLRHRGVGEVCVIGRPHAEWGEEVVAFLVPSGTQPVDSKQLDVLCLESIARFKRPKAYLFVDALPKNSYGKVLKRALRERVEGSR